MRHQAGTGKALPMAGPEHHNAWTSFRLARLKHQIRWTSLPMAGPKHQIRRTSLPMAGPKNQIRRTSLPMAGPKHQIRRTSLPMAGPKHQIRRTSLPMTVRQTYVRPAGPPCLWPDRPPALELTKLLNGGKGCSRRKHGYRKESGSRALLAFPLPLALYARVLSKPGELCIPCLGTDGVWRFLR